MRDRVLRCAGSNLLDHFNEGRTESCAGKRAGLRLGRVHGRAKRQRRTCAFGRNASRTMAVELFRRLERRCGSVISSSAGIGFNPPVMATGIERPVSSSRMAIGQGCG
jgi:hypothetical protein